MSQGWLFAGLFIVTVALAFVMWSASRASDKAAENEDILLERIAGLETHGQAKDAQIDSLLRKNTASKTQIQDYLDRHKRLEVEAGRMFDSIEQPLPELWTKLGPHAKSYAQGVHETWQFLTGRAEHLNIDIVERVGRRWVETVDKVRNSFAGVRPTSLAAWDYAPDYSGRCIGWRRDGGVGEFAPETNPPDSQPPDWVGWRSPRLNQIFFTKEAWQRAEGKPLG